VRNFDYAQQCFVHTDNPLARLTLAQMDAIFGAEHRRGPRNIRRWGELGLTGEWAQAHITPYSWRLDDSFAFYIQQAVLMGSHRWNCDAREYAHINRADGTIYDHGQQILDALAKDRHGIAISNIRYVSSSVKALPLAVRAAGPYVNASKRSLIDHSYPLARTIPAFVNRPPGTSVAPKVREFLNFILSRDGQQSVNQDGRYLPLSRELLLLQRRKLA
jgi:phosphate transport system substrate-binding protein